MLMIMRGKYCKQRFLYSWGSYGFKLCAVHVTACRQIEGIETATWP